MKNIKHLLQNKVLIFVFIAVFSIGGTLFVYNSYAQTPGVGIEPEQGQINGNARIFDDLSASAGKAIQFGGDPPTPTPALKIPLSGLVDRNPRPSDSFVLPDLNYMSVVNAAVINVSWSELQPDNSSQLNTAKVDNAIALARNNGIRLKLRVFTGQGRRADQKSTISGQVPFWVQNGAGTVLLKDSPTDTCDYSQVNPEPSTHCYYIARTWTSSFKNAYGQLQQKLAARYDSITSYPDLAEVVISGCSFFYPEPFLRGASNSAVRSFNINALGAAGYSAVADKQCQQFSMDVHSNYWKNTRSQFAFNPYEEIDVSTGAYSVNNSYTNTMIDYCRQVLEKRCVLGNYSLRSPDIHAVMNAKIKSKGPPISYQTAIGQYIGSWQNALNTAIGVGANSVELVAQDDKNASYKTYDLNTLTQKDSALQANPY